MLIIFLKNYKNIKLIIIFKINLIYYKYIYIYIYIYINDKINFLNIKLNILK